MAAFAGWILLPAFRGHGWDVADGVTVAMVAAAIGFAVAPRESDDGGASPGLARAVLRDAKTWLGCVALLLRSWLGRCVSAPTTTAGSR